MGTREIELPPEPLPELKLLRGRVHEVLRFPDPILKRRAFEVDDFTAEVSQLVDDLVETMLSHPGCVGLAAPQLGFESRIVVVDVSRGRKVPPVHHGLLCLINPKIVLTSGEQRSREGCASVPEFTANVTRAERVAIDYQDASGRTHALEAEGFEAIALQHEIDHLDGVLFLDRVRPEDVFLRKRKTA